MLTPLSDINLPIDITKKRWTFHRVFVFRHETNMDLIKGFISGIRYSEEDYSKWFNEYYTTKITSEGIEVTVSHGYDWSGT